PPVETFSWPRTLPVTTKKWIVHGQRHDPRGLKHRDPGAIRVVPIPPFRRLFYRMPLAARGPLRHGRA
ncbi:MAG: hypothetical protein WBH47_21770, partial [Streptosporangiaceae bacterium]